MPRFIPVASVTDIPAGQARAFVVGEREVAVFNVAGHFYAIENRCPHQGGPLADGWIDGETVTCPWHAWCYNVRDGKMTLGGFTSVDAFDVQVEGSTISVCSEPRA
jgi:nitrite reductase (NADH) small subunit/3-phenylpropionate/trans-cinnamate dioxygenase ferredoxin subunit